MFSQTKNVINYEKNNIFLGVLQTPLFETYWNETSKNIYQLSYARQWSDSSDVSRSVLRFQDRVAPSRSQFATSRAAPQITSSQSQVL